MFYRGSRREGLAWSAERWSRWRWFHYQELTLHRDQIISDQILMRSKFHIFNIYLIRHSSVSFTPPLHPCNLNCSRAVACVVNTLPWWTPFTRCWWERGLVNLVHVDVPSNPIKPKERFISKCFDVQVQRSPGYSWSVSFIGGFYGGDELRVLVLKTQRVVTAQG